MKDELGGKIMIEFVAWRAKVYAYRKIGKKNGGERCKGTKKCVVAEGLRSMTIRPVCLIVKQ